MKNSTDKIKEKCTIIAEAFEMPVLFINTNGEVTYENYSGQILNPLYENQKEKLFNPLNFKPEVQFKTPVIRKSAFSEKFILLSIVKKTTFYGTVIIGPSLSYPFSEDRISGIINDFRAFFYRGSVLQYYQSLPIIKPDKLVNISIIAFKLFNNILVSSPSVSFEDSSLPQDSKSIQSVNLTVSHNLQANNFHHDRLFEKNILSIIREGRVEDLKEFPYTKEEEEASVLSKSSYLRSNKNHIITMITLVSRASIDGGLHEEVAFSLHDSFIQQLEELNRLDDIRMLARDVLYTFARKVKQVKNDRHSRTITICKDYIFKYIYEDLTHEQIAKRVELSPKYLSVLFKKEVGITISEYIQQIKIEEAKKLLAYSNTPISDICSLLNYTDQSYFTKVFKKFIGVTPKFYRENHHLIDK
ncbi:helix-turn-helix domain-containing protein [Alkalihalobacillus hemicellulosilyticus]|uniref:Transcriptional regulator n=1 Tax=Halalkalibacter hemicellulosilyticusJCM 9152 TaxID=1236971 RepID=W4QHH9_9BACI|nr:helix-turn-helix domain-containing protein [Halalkalibacter hemicellulosilyticus]GAE31536.1 transcriptional regulator [Halalkalibacter hemicellulosilyticusJCM 9152]